MNSRSSFGWGPFRLFVTAMRGVLWVGLVGATGYLGGGSVEAQQHRATRLGHPSTRFADPLTRPEQLRVLLRDERLKPDVASILEQYGWPGDLEDLRRAAATAEIEEIELPVGTRMPFMSSRKDGRPVTLRDVEWAGDGPIGAYAFAFSSRGQRYRLVTPKACSNFYVVDLGPEAPRLELSKLLPAEINGCAPVAMKITVRNAGAVPLGDVRVRDELPPGLAVVGREAGEVVELTAGDLAPGGGREFQVQLRAVTGGTMLNRAKATSAQGAMAEAAAETTVRWPGLALQCEAPAEVFLGRPARVCCRVTNTGEAKESGVHVGMTLPPQAVVRGTSEGGVVEDGRVNWTLGDLEPGGTRTVCVMVAMPGVGVMRFAPTVQGDCAAPAGAGCETRVVGIPGILLEVVDVEDPVQVGEIAQYEIRVLNQGSAVGTNLRMRCQMAEEQEFVAAEGVTKVRTAEGALVEMEPLARLEPQATATWRVVVRAGAAGDARFKVMMTSDQFQAPVEEYESTQQY